MQRHNFDWRPIDSVLKSFWPRAPWWNGHFLKYLALDVTAYWIREIHCIALDMFDFNTVHKLSSKEKKSWANQDFNTGLLCGKQECFLCALQPRRIQMPPHHHHPLKRTLSGSNPACSSGFSFLLRLRWWKIKESWWSKDFSVSFWSSRATLVWWNPNC